MSPNDWMLSMDVTSLYTNIPHKDGLECISKVLETAETSTLKKESLLELLELVLTCNNFMFNNENYLQISSTAMGTKVACT